MSSSDRDPKQTSTNESLVDGLAVVAKDAVIGEETRVWQFAVILPGARIGKNCNICAHVLIEGNVILGDRVTVKPGVQLWNGMRIEDDVFIGPNATFSNDRHPRSGNKDFTLEPILLKRGCSIGAGAVVLPGITIGQDALVGAGAVVTKDVADGQTVYGNPARSK